MYIIYIFRTIVLIFVAMFITKFRLLYAPAFFRWLVCRKKKKKKKKTYNDNSKIAIWAQVKMVAEDIKFIIPRNSYTDVLKG